MRRVKLIHSVDARWVATVLILLATLWSTCIPAHAVFPGKNGRIAFIVQPDVFTMKSDGTDVRQLTSFGPGEAIFGLQL